MCAVMCADAWPTCSRTGRDEPGIGFLRVPGFKITTVRVEYDGICEECERKSAELADEMQGANQRRAC